jgi:hypothetical protein
MNTFVYEPIQVETPQLTEALALEVTAENVREFEYVPSLPTQSYLLFAYIYKQIAEGFYKMLTYKIENVEATEPEATAQAQREYDSLARYPHRRVCLMQNCSTTEPFIFLQETL